MHTHTNYSSTSTSRRVLSSIKNKTCEGGHTMITLIANALKWPATRRCTSLLPYITATPPGPLALCAPLTAHLTRNKMNLIKIDCEPPPITHRGSPGSDGRRNPLLTWNRLANDNVCLAGRTSRALYTFSYGKRTPNSIEIDVFPDTFYKFPFFSPVAEK